MVSQAISFKSANSSWINVDPEYWYDSVSICTESITLKNCGYFLLSELKYLGLVTIVFELSLYIFVWCLLII